MLSLSRKPSNALSRQASLPTTGSLTMPSNEQNIRAVEDAEEEIRQQLRAQKSTEVAPQSEEKKD